MKQRGSGILQKTNTPIAAEKDARSAQKKAAQSGQKKAARSLQKKELRKRVYSEVSVTETDNGFGIALDGRPLNTPGRFPLTTASKSLAEAVALEWNSQEENIDPASMPLSKLLNTSLDRVAPNRGAITAELLRYVDTDLLCYRVDSPESLAERQGVVWQPILDWLTATHGVTLQTGSGLMPLKQPEDAADKMELAISVCDDVTLTAVQAAAALTGSLALSLALAGRKLSGQETFAASQLDETWQMEKWGEDFEAAARRAQLELDLRAIEQFITLTR